MDTSLLIGDIVERDSSQKKSPVEFPSPSSPATGFPQHKRRSAFKQQRASTAAKDAPLTDSKWRYKAPTTSLSTRGEQLSFEDAERRRIDQENTKKLAGMTPQEIAQAQEDIMSGMNPALIQRLLQRATIDEPSSSPSPFDTPGDNVEQTSRTETAPAKDASQRAASHSGQPNPEPTQALPLKSAMKTDFNKTTKPSVKIADDYDEDQAPTQIPTELFPITEQPATTHFPVPPSLPDLDPSNPDFLATLHEKYFPNLPADPSKLAWMAPLPSRDSTADKDSPYYPHPEIAVSALRFDFRGRFLSPRVSRSIPSSKGLHHHGEAPEAAGYTIAELARLARSAVPAQRCMAYQTLGRILYRLGKGEWGKNENDHIAMGVWTAVKKGRVLESLMEAAGGEGGHRGSRAYATEALWLFEKGGWKETFKGR